MRKPNTSSTKGTGSTVTDEQVLAARDISISIAKDLVEAYDKSVTEAEADFSSKDTLREQSIEMPKAIATATYLISIMDTMSEMKDQTLKELGDTEEGRREIKQGQIQILARLMTKLINNPKFRDK